MNILVTGAGSLLGQGILRSLKFANNDNYNIVTADPSALSPGHWLGNNAYYLPLAKSEDYISKLESIISKENIDILLVGTDTELPIISKNKERLENSYDIKIAVAPEEAIHIANDKWLTAKFLKENNFPYPKSAMANDKEEVEKLLYQTEYPYLAKPIDGARSRGLVIIKNKEDLEAVCNYKNNLVVQELIPEDDGEYTSGCLVINGKCVSVVTLRRDLRDGNTVRTYRDKFSSRFDEIIADIAIRLKFDGPCNFQFRIRNNEPVIFEINCRYSGTTPIRSMYGFNEVEAYIEYLHNDKPVSKPELKEGIVFRVMSDILVERDDVSTLSNNGRLDSIKSINFGYFAK